MWHHQQSRGLHGHLVEVIERSRNALEHVTEALCDPGPGAASALPDAGKALHELRRAVEGQALAITETRFASAAVTVRTVVVAAQVNADAEGVEGLARRLAEIAGSRPGRPAAPAGVQAVVCRMGRICTDMMATAGSAARSPGTGTQVRIEAAGAEVRRLRQQLYRVLLHDRAAVDVDAALDAALACRYYARCAELAGSMARHAILGATSRKARQ
ncbi:hypothetical protein AB0H83_33070 [Dactylosporangium sp. NPDC050688]|uniref:hypothetical protein n=1 Tax=Dactylosporangium sp. NPDC050688 TaxID=3157217 RepID=UPI0033EA503F